MSEPDPHPEPKPSRLYRAGDDRFYLALGGYGIACCILLIAAEASAAV